MGYTNTTARQKVIDLAKKQATDGAHYLWGTRGGTPNEPVVIRGEKDVYFDTINWDPNNISFCAAKTDRGGTHVCTGRYARMTDSLPAGGKNPIVPTDPALAAFIAKNKGKPQTDWGTDLTPRKANWPAPGGDTTQKVWGEGCDGTRHFDCIGFICYCITTASGKQFGPYDIVQIFYAIEDRSRRIFGRPVTGKNMTDVDTDVWPADILIYGTVNPSSDAETYFQGRVDKDQKRVDRDNDDAKFSKDLAAAQAELTADQASLAAVKAGGDLSAIVPKNGIGVNLHHIAFATGEAKKIVQAEDSPTGVTLRDSWGSPCRRVRLDDTFF